MKESARTESVVCGLCRLRRPLSISSFASAQGVHSNCLMAGQAKRMFELDTEDTHSEPALNVSRHSSAPHLMVTQSVKDAFQLLLAARFQTVDFLAGNKQQSIMTSQYCALIESFDRKTCYSSGFRIFESGIETLMIYLGNILKYPTVSRYFTISQNNRIYRKAFRGIESEIHAFLVFLGSGTAFLNINNMSH